MKVLLANPRGFCAGVNMAIEVVEQALRKLGPPVYVFHEIVHNRYVVEDFRSRGVVFVDDIDEIPEGAVVIYSAHGISPDVRRRSGRRHLVEVDATCPLVTKVHLEVLRYAREGYRIVFIGHPNHDEAIGTVGEAPDCISVVERPEDVARLDFPPDAPIAYVTQTTLSLQEARRTIDALRARWPQIKEPARADVCYATTNRQGAVTALAAEADVVLVVGSRSSSNSRRLVETAEAAGKAGHLIDDASELDPQWLAGKESVLVTAGASAPEHLVTALLDRLRTEFGGEVEVRTLTEEDVSFALPRSLDRLDQLAAGQ